MAPNPRRQDEKLDALYAELPRMECQGRCANRCQTVLTMSRRERARLEEAHGEMTCDQWGWCKMFDSGRCKAYPIRPMFCRLWGLTEDMRCPYGCVPDRYLTPQEGAMFLRKADEIGGKGDHARELAKAS